MYRVEPKHSFPADITREDYIQPIDYLRPALGGCVLGLAYMAFITLVCMIADPGRAPIALMLGTTGTVLAAGFYGVTALFVAAVNHYIWLGKLRTMGPQAYQRKLSVQIPARQAFELCLASATQLNRPRITGLDEQKHAITIVSMSPWWWESARIDVKLDESIDGVTHITLTAQKSLTDVRLALLKMVWGPKWLPLVLAADPYERHGKMMDQVAQFITDVPNWNYQHSIGHDVESVTI